MTLGSLSVLESQLVLTPLIIVVIAGVFALVIADLEIVIRRQLGEEDDRGATVIKLPRRRRQRQTYAELEEQLLEQARARREGAGER